MRRALDQYFTPEWAAAMLLEYAPEIRGRYFLEPCTGKSDIANVLMESKRFDGGETNDIDERLPATFHGDITQAATWKRFGAVNWVVSNPPFNQAAQIIPQAFDFAENGIAMLLRLSYLEPCLDRDQWLATNPPTRLIVLPRISFTDDGKTDNVTCAWFVWDKEVSRARAKPNLDHATAASRYIRELENKRPIIIVPRPQVAASGQMNLAAA